ncbi:MAG TPA: hypothetical protein VF215_04120, partial [Thermoanaerobaculia bacterium]
GAVAFHYGPALTTEQRDFFGRFDVLVTHEPLPLTQVAELHRRGTKLALYEWAVAFYASRRTQWDERATLLNQRPLHGGVGDADADAFYYDPAAREHASGRSRAIAERLRIIGYDGIFLDTTTAGSVHPDALGEYNRRHPDLAYDDAFAQFLRALRAELPLILTNQGYRDAAHYLPYVDYDVTESLIVTRGRLRDFQELDALMQSTILPAARAYPHVRFIHLNYADDASDAAIVPAIAIARMYGQEAFVGLHDVRRTAIHAAYFAGKHALP